MCCIMEIQKIFQKQRFFMYFSRFLECWEALSWSVLGTCWLQVGGLEGILPPKRGVLGALGVILAPNLEVSWLQIEGHEGILLPKCGVLGALGVILAPNLEVLGYLGSKMRDVGVHLGGQSQKY